ncbi:MAG: Panacea domain-containing protein [Jiangellaceae bacterium]
MASAHDVAAYIVKSRGSMTAMKLQKLVYYSQAWHLVWESRPLFEEPIEAWANGPVVPSLYRKHRGRFRVDQWPDGDPTSLTTDELESIDAVLEFYSPMPAHELSELTHRERPWRDARGDLPPGAPCKAEITVNSMYEYYDGLVGMSVE